MINDTKTTNKTRAASTSSVKPSTTSIPTRSTWFTVERAANLLPIAILVGLLVTGAALNPNFWSWSNISNILVQNAPLALVAFGMTIVLISGAFDLSAGAILACGAVTFALGAQHTSLWVAGLLALLVGAAAGGINAYIVAGLKVNTFIGTIATGAIFTGVAFLLSGSSPIQLRNEGYDIIGLGRLGPLPWAVLVLVIVYLVLATLLNRTVFGRHLFATGGNSYAATLNGVPVGRTKTVAFLIVGVLSALGGIIIASQLGLGQPTLGGSSVALDAFAIVIIGGTSVFGGRGAMWRTVMGLMIIALMTNILNSLAWDSTMQSLASGVVLLLAVSLESKRHRSR